MRAIAALILGLAATAVLGAEIYTWRDASGKVHYGDAPPPGVEAKKLKAGVPADSGAAQRRSLAEQEQEFRKRRSGAEEGRAQTEKEQAEAQARRRDCEAARAQLEALESGRRVTRFDEKGERVFLNDEERAQATERTRRQVDQFCGK
ncbi:MAG: DUF4124 domain-containing protein [Rhodocyclales bacterium]|nr:DUF4124 domain-containing protein [Rhodocyclales bacterium]